MQEAELRKINSNFKIAALITAGILSVGVIFYHFVEKLSFIDALYLSVITLATVGYGDITPQTDVGKLFTCAYVLIGIAILATFANLFLKRAVLNHQYKQDQKHKLSK